MNSSGPTEADMARAAGFGNWVDRVAELEKELQDYRGCALHGWRKRDDKIERLEAENARLKAIIGQPVLSIVAAEHAATHSRLDAMGVPACDGCACRLTARLDWVAARLAGEATATADALRENMP